MKYVEKDKNFIYFLQKMNIYLEFLIFLIYLIVYKNEKRCKIL